MRRYLVVANRTLGGKRLVQELHERIADEDCSFYVIVPLTPVADYPDSLSLPLAPGFPGPMPIPANMEHIEEAEQRARDNAHERLKRLLELIADQGAAADGRLGDPNPIPAVEAVLAERDIDEIILSTLPAGPSRWLRLDLPSRLQRHVDVPVTVIEAGADQPDSS